MGLDGTSTPSQPGLRHLFDTLYRTRFAFVLAKVKRHGVPARDAADVAQDVFPRSASMPWAATWTTRAGR